MSKENRLPLTDINVLRKQAIEAEDWDVLADLDAQQDDSPDWRGLEEQENENPHETEIWPQSYDKPADYEVVPQRILAPSVIYTARSTAKPRNTKQTNISSLNRQQELQLVSPEGNDLIIVNDGFGNTKSVPASQIGQAEGHHLQFVPKLGITPAELTRIDEIENGEGFATQTRNLRKTGKTTRRLPVDGEIKIVDSFINLIIDHKQN